MSHATRIQFSEFIAAPATRVYTVMTDPDSYRQWTAVFCEGSYYEGSWDRGARIRFLSPGGEGMVAEVADNRPNAFISLRHLGTIANGVEDTTSEAVARWAPAYENYTFEAVDGGTRLVIDQDVTPDFEAYMRETWPKALHRLKELCEATG